MDQIPQIPTSEPPKPRRSKMWLIGFVVAGLAVSGCLAYANSQNQWPFKVTLPELLPAPSKAINSSAPTLPSLNPLFVPVISPSDSSSISFGFSGPDSTVGWKTYKNVGYGIEIKYPTSYEVKEYPDSVQISTVDGLENPEIQMRKIDIPLQEAVTEFRSSLGSEGEPEQFIGEKSFSFLGKPAVEIEYTSAMGGTENPRALFVQRDLVIRVDYEPTNELSKILSTLKFIEPTT